MQALGGASRDAQPCKQRMTLSFGNGFSVFSIAKPRASKTAQWMLAAKPDDLSFIPRTRRVEGESCLPKVIL